MAPFAQIGILRSRPLCASIVLLFTLLIFALFVSLSLRHGDSQVVEHNLSRLALDEHPKDAAEKNHINSTLGFHAILAVSTGTSWRQEGLLAAARLTDLDIVIPQQPSWSEDFVSAFQRFGEPNAIRPNRGSALAWLAHLDMLKLVIQSRFASALILEDDVDWDVGIKNQMERASKAICQFTNGQCNDTFPYGSDWDVLWFGHCGEHVWPFARKVHYSDPSTVPKNQYVSGAGGGNIVGFVSENERTIHATINALCTFAYAVNGRSADKVLEHASHGANEAFDLVLRSGCKSKALKCLTVNPEIMHHFKPADKYGKSSEVAQHNGEGHFRDGAHAVDIVGKTDNVLNSARCRAIFHSDCSGRT